MAQAKEEERDYSKPDSEMYEQAQTMCDNLTKYLEDFTPKFPFINTAYVTKFQVKINDGLDYITNRSHQDDTHVETAIVEKDMENTRVGVQSLFTYVKLAYKNDFGIQQEFGIKNYDKVSHNHSKFPEFVVRACEKAALPVYAAELLDKGYTSANLLALIALNGKLSTDIKLQQSEISEGVPGTQKRIILNNIIWAVMSEVSLCSKEVYSDNWGMQHVFLLYPNSNNTAIPPVPPTTPGV